MASTNASSSRSVSRAYLDAGISVIPLAADGQKKPETSNLPRLDDGRPSWKPFQERLPTEAEFEAMFPDDGRPRGIGIVCGLVSGGLEVLDIDDSSLGQIFLDAVEQAVPGLLARIPQVVSPRENGGRHLYLWPDKCEGNLKLAADEGGKTLIETRGTGGYIVAPGSHPDVHPAHRPYLPFEGTPSILTKPRISQSDRDVLFSIARGFNRDTSQASHDDGRCEPTADADAPGNVFSATKTFHDIGMLEKHGWARAPEHDMGDRAAWRRPGKTTPGHSALSGPDRYGHDRLMVFSSNGGPLKQGKSYSLFQAFAILEHRGDYSAAAKELAAQGYCNCESEQRDAEVNKGSVGNSGSTGRYVPPPIHVFPRPLREFVEAVSSSIRCDVGFALQPLLALLSVATGGTRRLRLKDRYLAIATIWSMLICESGTGKTPAQIAVMAPLTNREKRLEKSNRASNAKYAADLSAYETASRRRTNTITSIPPTPPTKPRQNRCLCSDTTIEGLYESLRDNPRGVIIVRDEIAAWVNGFTRYSKSGGSGDSADWASIHSGSPICSDRKQGGRVFADKPIMALTGGIQPDVFIKVFDEQLRDNGVLQRILPCQPDYGIKEWNRDGVSDDVQAAYEKVVENLFALDFESNCTDEPTPVDLKFTDPAYELWIEWYNAHHVATHETRGHLRSALCKLDESAARLILILHLARLASGEPVDPLVVDETSTQNALTLADWYRGEIYRLYKAFSPENAVAELNGHVKRIKRKHGEISVTVREVQRILGGGKTAQDAVDLLDKLVSQNFGYWEPEQQNVKRGRPTRRFFWGPVPAALDTSCVIPQANGQAFEAGGASIHTGLGSTTERSCQTPLPSRYPRVVEDASLSPGHAIFEFSPALSSRYGTIRAQENFRRTSFTLSQVQAAIEQNHFSIAKSDSGKLLLNGPKGNMYFGLSEAVYGNVDELLGTIKADKTYEFDQSLGSVPTLDSRGPAFEGSSSGTNVPDETANERTPTATVPFKTETLDVRKWNGEAVAGELLGVSAETSAGVSDEIPRLVALSASNGIEHFVVLAQDVVRFLAIHAHCTFVAHKAQFHHWVIVHAIGEHAEHWWRIVDAGRFRCTDLLEQLIRLARNDETPHPRGLAELAKQYLDVELFGKDDSRRLEFESIVGKDFRNVDPWFLANATQDSIAAVRIYAEQRRIARELQPPSSELLPDALRRFGPLTEIVQVKGAIALADITRRGMHINGQRLTATRSEIERMVWSAAADLDGAAPGAVRSGPRTPLSSNTARSLLRDSGGTLRIDESVVRQVFADVARDHNLKPPTSAGEKLLSLSQDYWTQHRGLHVAIDAYLEFKSHGKLLSFFQNLTDRVMHPSYQVLVRTGRTSCRNPNIQQIPREGGARESVEPSPGHVLLVIDYSAIELRTLAAVCRKRFGASKLAEVFEQGLDAHAYAYCQIHGLTFDQFEEWKRRDEQAAKAARNRIKPIVFGVPGSMQAKGLADYARRGYGQNLSVEEAETLRTRLTSDVFPEWSRFLDTPHNTVATLTGRVRSRLTRAGQYYNTQFQGLAADGLKLTLYCLVRAGFRVTATVHDEIHVELPIGSDLDAAATVIDQICCETMAEVTLGVPVACEYTISDRWSKQAKLVRDETGRIAIWSPDGVREQNVPHPTARQCEPAKETAPELCDVDSI